jgi:hypothetical protein
MFMYRLITTFNVPDSIKAGLDGGVYERVGGVIRECGSKQVVAWLRECDGQKIMSSMPGVPFLPMVSALNLGVTTIGFAVINQRLMALEEKLQEAQALLQKIDRKLDLSFHAKFKAALDLAMNAISMVNSENRRQSALAAISRFREIEPIYLDFVDRELEARSPVAGKYLMTLALAYVAEARCYLEIEEQNLALQWFPRWKEAFQPRARRYVEMLLTSNPAAYLDPQFKDQIDLSRLTRVYQWLDPNFNEGSVFELLRENLMSWPRDRLPESGHKWVNALPPAIAASAEVQGNIWGNRDQLGTEAMKRLPHTMERMEYMIETYRRFDGYELEVKSIAQMKMPFQKWRELAPAREIAPINTELMYIIPAKPLAIATL